MKQGWFKVYWDFLDNLTPESALLLAYLIEVEPIMKNRDGEYFRLSNSFIQERFLTWSPYTIKTKLDELEAKGYIEVSQKFLVEHTRGCKTRWIKINININDNANDNPNNNIKDNINNNTKKFNIKETKETKETKDNIYLEETSSSESNISSNSSLEDKKPGRKSRKDQFLEYVDSLDYQPETKDILRKWIFAQGLKGNVTVDQLKDKLKYIWSIHDDEALVRESIYNSYLSNYFAFFPVKQDKSASPTFTPQTYKTPETTKISPDTPIVKPKLSTNPKDIF